MSAAVGDNDGTPGTASPGRCESLPLVSVIKFAVDNCIPADLCLYALEDKELLRVAASVTASFHFFFKMAKLSKSETYIGSCKATGCTFPKPEGPAKLGRPAMVCSMKGTLVNSPDQSSTQTTAEQ